MLQSAAEQLLGPLGAGGRQEGGDGDEAVGGRELLEELLDEEWNEAEIASVRGRAARFVAARLCVPCPVEHPKGRASRGALRESP